MHFLQDDPPLPDKSLCVIRRRTLSGEKWFALAGGGGAGMAGPVTALSPRASHWGQHYNKVLRHRKEREKVNSYSTAAEDNTYYWGDSECRGDKLDSSSHLSISHSTGLFRGNINCLRMLGVSEARRLPFLLSLSCFTLRGKQSFSGKWICAHT